jgi:rhamnulose-1-phosphate aldolase/alcohol dehydrogenase|tara:strand:- start:18419 stop:20599 length:2181 start_codon:yes stop_codon:yes gene_type:complete
MKHPELFESVWDDEVAEQLDPVERLVYRSNLLGSDQRITNTGGGNTSAKLKEVDPLTGKEVSVLWVKGSGGDLRTSTRENFASLYLDRLQGLDSVYQAREDIGYKSAAEDAMVGLFGQCTYCMNLRASSIDTPLHSMIHHTHVDHLHPISVIAIASCEDQEQLTQEVWQGALAYVPWARPGWEAAKLCEHELEKNANIKGVLLGQHGHTSWASNDKSCYETSLWVIQQAADYISKHDKGDRTFGGQKYANLEDATRISTLTGILPRVRGMVSQQQRFIATVQSDERVLEFVNSNDGARLAHLGTSCPDHFLRTKIKPLYVDWDPQVESVDELEEKIRAGLLSYRNEYAKYYERNRDEGSPPMRDASPTVMLIPGLGMIAWGKNKSESRVTAEFYNSAIAVMRGAEAVSSYTALPQKEAFDIEYWSLEEAKLKRMPSEAALERKIVVVVGAADGIGKATALRAAQDGAHVICADLRLTAAQCTADEITSLRGRGIGIAGTGISCCGPSIALEVDISDRCSVASMFESIVIAYGGIDSVVVTAGVFIAPGQASCSPDEMFDRSYAVNVKGAYIVATEAERIWKSQKIDGELVIATSVNAVVAKKGSIAYDTSKAAVSHLIRELAVELAPWVRVNGIAPAAVVAGSSMFPRDRVAASLTKYAVDFDEKESEDQLRNRLSEFYAQRTLLKKPISPDDLAEAAFLLISGKLSKTTGQVISVDGGLPDAFLR